MVEAVCDLDGDTTSKHTDVTFELPKDFFDLTTDDRETLDDYLASNASKVTGDSHSLLLELDLDTLLSSVCKDSPNVTWFDEPAVDNREAGSYFEQTTSW